VAVAACSEDGLDKHARNKYPKVKELAFKSKEIMRNSLKKSGEDHDLRASGSREIPRARRGRRRNVGEEGSEREETR